MQRRSVLQRQTVRREGKRLSVAGHVLQWLGTGLLRVILLLSLIVAVSAGFVLLYQHLLRAPYLKLQEVKVEGLDPQVRDRLLVQCGLNSGVSLLELNLKALRREMEMEPWVRTARLHRKFPHTLVVKAEQQRPVALVLTDTFHYMNGRGELFKKVEPGEPRDLPVITGLAGQAENAHGLLVVAAEMLRAVGITRPPWSVSALSEIHLGTAGVAALYFQNLPVPLKVPCYHPAERWRPAEVRSGKWAVALARHLERFRRVAEHLAESGRIGDVTGIDLSNEDGVVVTFGAG